MTPREKQFHTESRQKVFDPEHRRKISHALGQSDIAFEKGKSQFMQLQSAKDRAKFVKWEVVNHLDRYLIQFEENFKKSGGKVIWAENAQQALDAILEICRLKHTKTMVKSKSMVSEEIHLNPYLSGHGIEVIETDLGEYIQQLCGEPPYHIVAPSLHKSREEVALLFHEKLGAPPGLSPGELTLVARNKLRNEFRRAEIGLTGANFLLADIGGVAITENEGNARLSTGFPRTHIVITGIEKILPSVHDLHLFWPLLATHGSGQKVTVYNSVFTGPRQPGETDGPEEMYVVLLDNGRTRMMEDPVARESLGCIRCGACLNVCPVYRNIGGHTYQATYGGPIGSVITPHLAGMRENKHLSYASSLCGSCTEVCPVGIDLHRLLLHNRRLSVSRKQYAFTEKGAWKAWKKVVTNRSMMDMLGGRIKNIGLKMLFRNAWGSRRALPDFAEKSFGALWQERAQSGKNEKNNQA